MQILGVASLTQAHQTELLAQQQTREAMESLENHREEPQKANSTQQEPTQQKHTIETLAAANKELSAQLEVQHNPERLNGKLTSLYTLQKERAEKQKTVSELTIARNALARIQSELLDSKVKAMTQQKETMVVTLEVAAEM